MRNDQYANTVSVDGIPLGIWDTLAGGGVTAGETKYKPGGMVPQVSLGGSKVTENVTLTRLYELQRDHELCRQLMGRTGRAQVVVSRQPLDPDAMPYGRPFVYTGILMEIHPGDTDSKSEDANVWTMVVSTSGDVA